MLNALQLMENIKVSLPLKGPGFQGLGHFRPENWKKQYFFVFLKELAKFGRK